MPTLDEKPWPLVGYLEIAARAGVKRPVVTIWRTRNPESFPEPVVELETGPVWFWPEVRDWLDQTGRVYDEEAKPEPKGTGERARQSQRVRERFGR
jgi:predicted DNA-binding transcriptional regulator AlpA